MLRLVPYRNDRSMDMFHMMDEFFKTSEKPMKHFKLDVIKHEDAYLVEAEIPGVNRENIEIDYEDNLLHIRVKREEKTEDKGKNYLHKERHISSMERVLRFENIDQDHIEAKLEDGILSVTLPTQVLADNKKKIEIQ